MSTVELKDRLIDKILHTENPELLGEVFRLLEMGNEEMEPLRLSEFQQKAIVKGQDDIKAGHFLANEQADNEIEKWLNE
ncbi:hypothetical protein [Rufibacter sp. LB8]|uniref:hypothetical protein n=1 Tax=Rufibacter sp. LB8 TaxID=2777781 RepID=UPI00178C6449|nr:hypothetical protein [Rufibacter sp. LB8]